MVTGDGEVDTLLQATLGDHCERSKLRGVAGHHLHQSHEREVIIMYLHTCYEWNTANGLRSGARATAGGGRSGPRVVAAARRSAAAGQGRSERTRGVSRSVVF